MNEFLLMDYCLTIERRLARPSDLESNTGGSISFW
jgi:hypothetical protein